MAPGPLAGIRVLEFAQIIAGPYGCQHLADMGADVIKVEPIGGEPWRHRAPFRPGESKQYHAMNRGKRSIALDLTASAAIDAVHRLVPSCDVVVTNYRPDVAVKLSIDYATLSGIRPDLVYVDSTSFGRRGPWAMKPGYDLIAQASAGIVASGGRFDDAGVPVQPAPVAIADVATSYAIAWGVSAALFHRERTGQGQLVETSLLINALNFQSTSFMSLPAADDNTRGAFLRDLHEGRSRGASFRELVESREQINRGRLTGNIYYRCYLTSDGAIALANLSASLRSKFRAALGIDRDPRDDDPKYDPLAPAMREFGEQLVAHVEQQIAQQSTAYWLETLEAAGVPVTELFFTEELSQHPHVLANDYVVELEHDLAGTERMVAPPLRMSKSPVRPRGASPPLGRDTDEILEATGYSSDEIAALRSSGVVA